MSCNIQSDAIMFVKDLNFKKMKKNIGITDRIIRFVAIDLLLGFSFMGFDIPMYYATIAFVLSMALVLTIITAYSPLYHLFEISTLEKKIA